MVFTLEETVIQTSKTKGKRPFRLSERENKITTLKVPNNKPNPPFLNLNKTLFLILENKSLNSNRENMSNCTTLSVVILVVITLVG